MSRPPPRVALPSLSPRRRGATVAAVEGGRPEQPQQPPPRRFSSFAALGRAFGLGAPAAEQSMVSISVPHLEMPVVDGVYTGLVTGTYEHGAFVVFLHGQAPGLLYDTSLGVGDRVRVQLQAVTAEGRFRLVRAPASAPAPAKRKKQRRPAGEPAKQYKGLGVRTWEDVDCKVASGGWEFVASNSNEHWCRTTPCPDGGPPLVQSLFLAASPSDSFHGPQKAAATIRRKDKERDAFLSKTPQNATSETT